jgi:putative transposase
MVRYRRNYEAGGTYFFTVVTNGRLPFFREQRFRTSLRNGISRVRKARPFTIDAIVLLYDHLHTVWTLPEGDSNYPVRWKQIKEHVKRETGRTVCWQDRYWEHTCTDMDDLTRCIEYIHYNPVRHGYVTRVRDWPWSSFHRFVKSGIYPLEWGEGPVVNIAGAEWE